MDGERGREREKHTNDTFCIKMMLEIGLITCVLRIVRIGPKNQRIEWR